MVVQQFGDIERVAQHDSLQEVSVFLGKARMAWLAADETRKKQTDVRSYLSWFFLWCGKA